MIEPIRPGLSNVIPGCVRIEPTAPDVLKGIFDNLPISTDDILIDIGCGDGDVIAHWLHMGLKNIMVGVELHGQTYETTKERFADNVNVSILHKDASKWVPGGTIYYLFNPFRGEQMAGFEKLVPKTARIVYYNPTELGLFYEWKATEIWLRHPKAVLLTI